MAGWLKNVVFVCSTNWKDVHSYGSYFCKADSVSGCYWGQMISGGGILSVGVL